MSHDRMHGFLRFSAEVTAFKQVELVGTGEAERYLATLDKIAGKDTLDALLTAYAGVESCEGAQRERQLRITIFGDERLGPIARNIIKLWYVGVWYELPHAYREAYGVQEGDRTFTVSPNAYTQGLLWTAAGANPAGARAPGYASWTTAPRLPRI